MTKKLAVVESENIEIVKAITNYFENKDVKIEFVEDLNAIDFGFDLVVLTGFETSVKDIKNSFNLVNIHPSLLPAFSTETALQDAFTSGVKVSGISIHSVDEGIFFGKILAQYPVLIGLDTHFDEYKREIFEISKKLYPIVIEAILEDRVFDFTDLFKSSCSKGCGGCSGGSCSH